MAFDLTAGLGWQFKIHIVRKRREDLCAAFRMVSHAEETRKPEFSTGECLNGCVHYRFDSRRIGQSVVDQTRLDCSQDAGLMLRVQSGNSHLNAKLRESRWLSGLFRGYLHFKALAWQRPCFQILRSVKPGASP
jgi:hypothetical protein